MKTQLAAVIIAVLTFALQAPYSLGDDAPDPSLELEEAARILVRSQVPPDFLEELYSQAAEIASVNFRAEMQANLDRPISDSEEQRLYLFWHEKIKELVPYSIFEDLLVPIVTRHLNLEELREINRFNETETGKKLASLQATMAREARSAGEELARKMSDSEWMDRTVEDLKAQFPQWFPEPEEETDEE